MSLQSADTQRVNAAIVGVIVEALHPSAAAFEARYAARSGVSAEQLRRAAMCPLPCTCDEESCEGWQMLRLVADVSIGEAAIAAMQ